MTRSGDRGFAGRSGLAGLVPMNAPRRAHPISINDNFDPAARMRAALKAIAGLALAGEGEGYEAALALVVAVRDTATAALEDTRP